MAKWSTGAHVIEQPADATQQWLVATVRQLADKAGISMPNTKLLIFGNPKQELP